MSEQEGTIARKRQFAQVPDELATDKRLSAWAVRVWLRLSKYAGKDGQAFPAQETVADDIGCSVATVKRALADLVSTGWITRRKRGFSNVVHTTLNDAPTVTGDPPERSRVTRPQTPRKGHPRPPGKVTGDPPDGSRVTRPKKETHFKETQPKDSVADATGSGELDLGLPPAPAAGQAPAQILVGAYADAYTESGGQPTKAVLAACGRNVKRLIDQDGIPLPVLLQAVRRAGAARSKDIDRHLGEAQQAYGRTAARKALFAAWDDIAASLDSQQTQIGA